MEDFKFRKFLAIGIIILFIGASVAVANIRFFSDVEESISARAINLTNGNPNKPKKPSGNSSGYICIEYNYSTSTTDPSDLNITYGWDWDGDLIVDEWTEEYESNETCNITHIWLEPGIFNVSVIANNTLGNLSEWSDSLNVTMENHPPNEPNTPIPPNGSIDIDIDEDLNWICDDPDTCDTLVYDVYFGTDPDPPLVMENISDTSYDPGALNLNTKYYWKIIATDNHNNSTEGPIWNFTTRDNNPPDVPDNPNPNNGELNVDINEDLSWTCTDPDGDTLTYDIYIDDSTPPKKEVSNHPVNNYDPGPLLYNTKYYWKIVARDSFGELRESPIWSFTTLVPEPPTVNIDRPKKGAFYLRNFRILPLLFNTIVYGPIDIIVNASSEVGIEKVELYINNKLKETWTDEPYTYKWSPLICMPYRIKAIAYDNADQNVSTTVTVLKWRVHPILLLVGSLIVFGQMRTPLKRTLIRGTVFNLRRVGNMYHGRAIRLHFTELSGLTRTSGVTKLKRVSFKHSPLVRTYDLGPLGLTTYIIGIVPGGID
jgi:hypothetical protein